MEKARTYGQIAESMSGNGRIISCTEKELKLGQMADATKDSTSKTRNMVKVSTPGPMARSTTDPGKMVSNTEKEHSTIRKPKRLRLALGSTESAMETGNRSKSNSVLNGCEKRI